MISKPGIGSRFGTHLPCSKVWLRKMMQACSYMRDMSMQLWCWSSKKTSQTPAN